MGLVKRDVIQKIKAIKKTGKKHFIVVVAEGIGGVEAIADRIEQATGIESRATILGHVQRGGSPTVRDRVMASQFGYRAVELLRDGIGNRVVTFRENKIGDQDIYEALAMNKVFNIDEYNMATAISL